MQDFVHQPNVNPATSWRPSGNPGPSTVNPRKLEHGFRRILARIPYTLPEGHEDIDVPTFWHLLYRSLSPAEVPECP